MIDPLFVIYVLMLALMLGLAVAGDARRRARNRAQHLGPVPATRPDIA